MKQLSFVVKSYVNSNNVPVKHYIPKLVDGGITIEQCIVEMSKPRYYWDGTPYPNPYNFAAVYGEIIGKGVCKGLPYVTVKKGRYKAILIPIDGGWGFVKGSDGFALGFDESNTADLVRLLRKGFTVEQAEKDHNRDGIWF